MQRQRHRLIEVLCEKLSINSKDDKIPRIELHASFQIENSVGQTVGGSFVLVDVQAEALEKVCSIVYRPGIRCANCSGVAVAIYVAEARCSGKCKVNAAASMTFLPVSQ